MRQGVIRFAIVGATPGLLSLTKCEDVCIAVIQQFMTALGQKPFYPSKRKYKPAFQATETPRAATRARADPNDTAERCRI